VKGSADIPISRSPSDLMGLALRFFELWNVGAAVRPFVVTSSRRLTQSVARTYPERAVIRVCHRLLADYTHLVPEVICHESAHLAVYWKHGPHARPHGPEWAALITVAGFEPRRKLFLTEFGVTSEIEIPTSSQYLHRCMVCQSSRLARRPNVRWRCGRCIELGLPGELTIERVSL